MVTPHLLKSIWKQCIHGKPSHIKNFASGKNQSDFIAGGAG